MGVEAVAVTDEFGAIDISRLLDNMHDLYVQVEDSNQTMAVVLMMAAQVIVAQARQLAEARAEKPRIVVP